MNGTVRGRDNENTNDIVNPLYQVRLLLSSPASCLLTTHPSSFTDAIGGCTMWIGYLRMFSSLQLSNLTFVIVRRVPAKPRRLPRVVCHAHSHSARDTTDLVLLGRQGGRSSSSSQRTAPSPHSRMVAAERVSGPMDRRILGWGIPTRGGLRRRDASFTQTVRPILLSLSHSTH